MPEWLTRMASYAKNRECIGDNRHWDGDIKWPIWWYQRLYLGIMLTRVDDMRNSIIPVRLPCLLPGAPLTSVVLSEVSRVAGRVWVMYQRIKSQIARFMGPTWGPPGSCRPQMGPRYETLLFFYFLDYRVFYCFCYLISDYVWLNPRSTRNTATIMP